MTDMMKIREVSSKMMASTVSKRTFSPTVQRTELCQSIKAGLECRYGDACKFVHDRSRLPSTLDDLVQLNQIKKEDIMTYRNRPCFDFVSTGTWYVLGHDEAVLFITIVPLYCCPFSNS